MVESFLDVRDRYVRMNRRSRRCHRNGGGRDEARRRQRVKPPLGEKRFPEFIGVQPVAVQHRRDIETRVHVDEHYFDTPVAAAAAVRRGGARNACRRIRYGGVVFLGRVAIALARRISNRGTRQL